MHYFQIIAGISSCRVISDSVAKSASVKAKQEVTSPEGEYRDLSLLLVLPEYAYVALIMQCNIHQI